MTKAEMVSRLCEKAHVSKEDSTNLVEGTFEIIKAFLERGEPVKISGFGKFLVRTKRPRKGRDPTTGAEILIPGHTVVTFKASSIMKKSITTTQSD